MNQHGDTCSEGSSGGCGMLRSLGGDDDAQQPIKGVSDNSKQHACTQDACGHQDFQQVVVGMPEEPTEEKRS